MNTEGTIHLHGVAHPVTSLGPGRRAAIWVAGCNRRCKGCIAPELFNRNAGHPVFVDSLVRMLQSISMGLDGLTVSGGEPADQPKTMVRLLRLVRQAIPSWTIILYSGYTREQLSCDYERSPLLSLVDVLIDGPYCRDIPSGHPLTGSGNQIIHYLTPMGQSLEAAFERIKLGLDGSRFNVAIDQTGNAALLVGVSDAESRSHAHDVLQAAMGERVR